MAVGLRDVVEERVAAGDPVLLRLLVVDGLMDPVAFGDRLMADDVVGVRDRVDDRVTDTDDDVVRVVVGDRLTMGVDVAVRVVWDVGVSRADALDEREDRGSRVTMAVCVPPTPLADGLPEDERLTIPDRVLLGDPDTTGLTDPERLALAVTVPAGDMDADFVPVVLAEMDFVNAGERVVVTLTVDVLEVAADRVEVRDVTGERLSIADSVGQTVTLALRLPEAERDAVRVDVAVRVPSAIASAN